MKFVSLKFLADGKNYKSHSDSFQVSIGRTVLRTTCVKDYNMVNPQEYANIIEKTDPDFIEIKAYMYVGSSRDRLTLDNMPSVDHVTKFAESIAKLCGREIVNEAFESRVVLLA